MWQAEADTDLTLSASPATAVGQSKLYPGESRLEYGGFQDLMLSIPQLVLFLMRVDLKIANPIVLAWILLRYDYFSLNCIVTSTHHGRPLLCSQYMWVLGRPLKF